MQRGYLSLLLTLNSSLRGMKPMQGLQPNLPSPRCHKVQDCVQRFVTSDDAFTQTAGTGVVNAVSQHIPRIV